MAKEKKSTAQKSPRNILLFIIFLLAVFVRVYNLGALPSSFYVEEMTNTYVGKFILLHGRDIFNHWLPLIYFDKFGDYPPVLPLYVSGLSALIFGPTEFAGRLPIALSGALLVFPVYGLLMLMLNHKKSAYFGAAIAAITPWHIVLSRTTAEGVVGLTVYAYALLWILEGIIKDDIKRIYKSFMLFFLTYFLYPGLRVITPMTLLPLPFIAKSLTNHVKKALFLGLIGAVVLTAYIISTPWGRARYNQTSLFHDPQIKVQIQNRSQSLSSMLGANQVTRARIFHNKYVLYTREFVSQYLNYFSPKYLFFESGGQFRYYNVPDQGLLYLSVIPFLAGAVLFSQKTSGVPLLAYILYLLAIMPITAALTTDFSPHAHRSMFMSLPLFLLAAFGFRTLSDGKRIKRIGIAVIGVVMIAECVYFWHQYSGISNSYQSTLRNDGDPELVKYVLAHKTEYEHVYITKFDRIPLYYLFYSNNFDRSLLGQFEPGFSIQRVDNVTFVDHNCASALVPTEALTKHILVVDNATGCDGKKELHGVSAINRKDGTSAYRILSTR